MKISCYPLNYASNLQNQNIKFTSVLNQTFSKDFYPNIHPPPRILAKWGCYSKLSHLTNCDENYFWSSTLVFSGSLAKLNTLRLHQVGIRRQGANEQETTLGSICLQKAQCWCLEPPSNWEMGLSHIRWKRNASKQSFRKYL